MACSCCSGTDCARECDQGQCYAEEQQRWFAQQAAEEEAMLEQLYEDSLAAAQIVGELAMATA
jgi:hypothetical protein